jgi:hypothetical protein
MVEQLSETTKQFGVGEYLNSGGRWDRKTFDRLMEIVDERETNPIRVRGVFIDQAQGMGFFTGLVITPEEKYLYGVLCHEPIEKTLCQQQLLAEVMLVMGNPDKRNDFMRMYPTVDFNYSLLQRETSKPRERTRQIAYGTEVVVFAYGQ